MLSPEPSISGGYLRGVLADGVGRARYGGGRASPGAGAEGGRVSPALQPPPVEFVYTLQPFVGAAYDAFVPSPLEAANALPDREGWAADESAEEALAQYLPLSPSGVPAADAKPPAAGAVAPSRQAEQHVALPGTAAPMSVQPPASDPAPQAYHPLTRQPALGAARETSPPEPVAAPQMPVSATSFPPRVAEPQAPPLQETRVADRLKAPAQPAPIEAAAVRRATARPGMPATDSHVAEVADVSPTVAPVVLPQRAGGAVTVVDPAGAARVAAQPRRSGADQAPQPAEQPGITIAARTPDAENRSPAQPAEGPDTTIARMEVGIPGVSERRVVQPAHPSSLAPFSRGVKEAASPPPGALPPAPSRENENGRVRSVAAPLPPGERESAPVSPGTPPAPPPEHQASHTLAVRAAGERRDAPAARLPTAATQSDSGAGGVSPAGRVVFERIAQLQQATQDLAAKLAAQQARSREPASRQQPVPPPPPPVQPVVIIHRTAGSPTAPRAFWERSYLGRASLRGCR